MPSNWAKGDPAREKAWKEAKAIISKEYPEIRTDSDRYYALVMTVAKNKVKGKTIKKEELDIMNNTILKESILERIAPKSDDTYYQHWRAFSSSLFDEEVSSAADVAVLWEDYKKSNFTKLGSIDGPITFLETTTVMNIGKNSHNSYIR